MKASWLRLKKKKLFCIYRGVIHERFPFFFKAVKDKVWNKAHWLCYNNFFFFFEMFENGIAVLSSRGMVKAGKESWNRFSISSSEMENSYVISIRNENQVPVLIISLCGLFHLLKKGNVKMYFFSALNHPREMRIIILSRNKNLNIKSCTYKNYPGARPKSIIFPHKLKFWWKGSFYFYSP